MNEVVFKTLKEKDFIIKNFLIKVALELKLSLNETILLVYFMNQEEPTLNIENITSNVYLNEEDHSDIQTSKRLWCLGNFSKFINEGAVRIACTSGTENLSSCAFKNTDGSTVIVYVNASENDSTTNLNHISYNNLDVYTTDETRNIEKTEINENTVNVPSQSVVTVVLK